jgi:hypothetical protein
LGKTEGVKKPPPGVGDGAVGCAFNTDQYILNVLNINTAGLCIAQLTKMWPGTTPCVFSGSNGLAFPDLRFVVTS